GLDQQPAFITQNGGEMRLLNEAGQPSRAWVDYPGHIWADTWQTGAIFSPDGSTIQFDSGTGWHGSIPPPSFPRRRMIQPPPLNALPLGYLLLKRKHVSGRLAS